MKTVLGIDTSTLTASVALVRGSGASAEVLAEGESNVNTHSQELIELVDRALAEASLSLADVDGIAIGAGPGSFTGLRIGMATAKGLAFAAQKPLWAVSSLAALAFAGAAGASDILVIPVLDARRGEIFVGFYRIVAGAAEAVAGERVMAPEALDPVVSEVVAAAGCGRVLAVGDGLAVYADQLVLAGVTRAQLHTPPARAVATLVLSGDHPDILAQGAPSYIRPAEAEIKFPRGNPGGTFSRA